MHSNQSETPVYPVGKLPQDDLLELLTNFIDIDDPRLIEGPGLGCDAAVVDFGDRYLVAKTDPITFASDEIGWYVVNVNANDIACLGAQPRWFIATLLLPEAKTGRALVQRIFRQLSTACRDLGALLIGGHTEITHGLDRPIVVGAMFGEVAPEDLVRSDGARPGDVLILTKGIAVEGTTLLAREVRARLQHVATPEQFDRAAQFLYDPGISVVRDAAVAAAAGAVHAMHDPTEGGIATGVWELTEAAGLGAVVDEGALPIYPETRVFCDALRIDPLGLIASGSLLASVASEDAPQIVRQLQASGIQATAIGTVCAQPGVILRSPSGQRPMPKFARDEIARLFD